MFENKDLALSDNDADKHDHDNDNDNGRTQRLNSWHEKDDDNNHKRRQRRISKHRRSDSLVDVNRSSSTRTKDSTSSDSSSEDTNEKRRKRRHSKKRKHRKSDSHRRRNDEDDDDSHSREKKSKKKSKKKHKTAKQRTISSINSESLSHTTSPAKNENTQRNEQQAIFANQADRTNESFQDEPVRRTKPNMIPMTRQEYEQEQKQIRNVYDPESGRVRLIRGSGEIIESMVGRSQHRTINQMATRTDGQSYTKHVFANAAATRKR